MVCRGLVLKIIIHKTKVKILFPIIRHARVVRLEQLETLTISFQFRRDGPQWRYILRHFHHIFRPT